MPDSREPFNERNLPAYPASTVTLFSDQLARFRDDYSKLLEFCAFIIGKDAWTMCDLDFAVWLRTQDEDTIHRSPPWVQRSAAALVVLAQSSEGD
jgi:hypothetical protein